MAQHEPDEQATFEQVLKLVENLAPDAQEQLIEVMKLQWLRRELGIGEEQLRRGYGIPAEQVFAELEAEYERRKASAR